MDIFDTRQNLFDTMAVLEFISDSSGKILLPNVPMHVDEKVIPMVRNKDRYQYVARQFSNKFLKWYVIALIHEMEGEQNFNTYLGNGQSIQHITTIVPKGRGPFKNFEAGAIDALNIQRTNNKDISTVGKLLYFFESYNGFGYKKTNTPYLWSGSNQYIKGKYVKDGIYDPNYVSTQIGIALMFKRLVELGAVTLTPTGGHS